jgi:predicted HAD superfamily Cof-like phosphohydrolase
MEKQLKALKEFNEAFDIYYSDKPRLTTNERARFRNKLMQEELAEYEDANAASDLAGVLDGLTDALYILIGTIYEHGMQDVIVEAFDIVQASNMSKLDEYGRPVINGRNGVLDTRKPIGKVLKSKRFIDPTDQLKALLNRYE